MDNILPDNEFVEVEGRVYSNPQTGLDESQSFIENLRSTQGQQNQQIATDTYNLGTAVPSVQGGLGAPTDAGLSYFTSRYQTPQTNATVANLRATAQAAALNEVLQNEQEMWKKRYNDAYRAYQKSAYDKANAPTTTGGGGGLGIDTNSSEDGKTKLDLYTDGQYEKERLYPVTDYVSDWQDTSGQWWQVGNPTLQDKTFGPTTNPLKYKQTNGNIVSMNGKNYLYISNVENKAPGWYPVTRSAGPGTYSPRYY